MFNITTAPMPYVRAYKLCLGCHGLKSSGRLLCLQCHYEQMREHDGEYDAAVINRLESYEIAHQEAMQEIAARRRMDCQDMRAEGKRDE